MNVVKTIERLNDLEPFMADMQNDPVVKEEAGELISMMLVMLVSGKKPSLALPGGKDMIAGFIVGYVLGLQRGRTESIVKMLEE